MPEEYVSKGITQALKARSFVRRQKKRFTLDTQVIVLLA
jgi:hypothetical protein